MPRGYWNLLLSSTGGEVQYQMTEGVTKTDGSAITEEDAVSIGVEMQHRALARVGLGDSGSEAETSVALSVEASVSVARQVSNSLAMTSQQALTVTCAAPPANRSKAWLYQWVMEYKGSTVRTGHTRCHHTNGTEYAPQCPFTACGVNNEWCQREKCYKFTE